VEFVKTVNANSFAANHLIVQLVKNVSTTLAFFHAQVMVSAAKTKLAMVELVCLDVEATKIVLLMKLVLAASVKILVTALPFVVQMQSAIVTITRRYAFVQPGLNQIQHQIKDVFVCHQFVQPQKHVLRVTCASLENATYPARTQVLVLLVKDASIIYAQRCVTPTTTAYLERFVTRESVFLAVLLMLIVPTLKSVYNQNASVVKDLL
jgi:hypothetical protein